MAHVTSGDYQKYYEQMYKKQVTLYNRHIKRRRIGFAMRRRFVLYCKAIEKSQETTPHPGRGAVTDKGESHGKFS